MNRTDDELRARFGQLGRHLEQAVDATPPSAGVLPAKAGGPHERRPMLAAAVAAALLLVAGAGVWFASGDSDGRGSVSTSDIPPSTVDTVLTTEVSAGVWPPPAEVHEHCVEDEQTRALYAEGSHPSESLRAQICEHTSHEGLLQPVATPEGVGPGAVRSDGPEEGAASEAFNAALAAQGMSSDDLGTSLDTQILWKAFENRYARPVVDRNGEQIGWFGGGAPGSRISFVSLEDMPAARAEADRVIAEFERTGELPSAGPGD